MNRFRALVPKFALAILSPVLLLALLEGVFRLADFGLPTSFLLSISVQGAPSWVNNPFYGYRFFSPELARNPPPLAVAQSKSTDVVRIVVLGESAAMGDPLIEFGAPRMLEKMLNHTGAAPRFEVVNAAMTAVNSPIIADIARDLDRLRPDLVLIYMGNNEVVGPFAPTRGVRGRLGTRLIPLRVALTRWRSLLGLKTTVDFLASIGRQPRQFQMDALGRAELRADDLRLDSVYNLFSNRLDQIIKLSRRAGAEVVLSTIAVNLTACPPFGSAHRADWIDADEPDWQSAWAAGLQAQKDGRANEALAAYRAAAKLDRGHAELAFRLAQTLEQVHHADEATAWYSLARDNDTRRFRADGRLNQIIKETAFRRSVHLIDAEQDFLIAARDSDLFLDHVHFTFEGTYRIASLWFDAVIRNHSPRDKPSLAVCRERLMFTPWRESRQAQAMASRYARPPFTGQLDDSQRREAYASVIARCTLAISRANLLGVRSAYEKEAARDPTDLFLPFQWGTILLESNRLPEALPLLLDYADRLPQHFEARLKPAFVLAKANQPEQAVDLLLGTGPPYGHFLADLGTGVVEALLADGFRGEARHFGQRLLERQPRFINRRRFADLIARL